MNNLLCEGVKLTHDVWVLKLIISDYSLHIRCFFKKRVFISNRETNCSQIAKIKWWTRTEPTTLALRASFHRLSYARTKYTSIYRDIIIFLASLMRPHLNTFLRFIHAKRVWWNQKAEILFFFGGGVCSPRDKIRIRVPGNFEIAQVENISIKLILKKYPIEVIFVNKSLKLNSFIFVT